MSIDGIVPSLMALLSESRKENRGSSGADVLDLRAFIHELVCIAA
jgi:hypothetical protein